MRYLVFSFSFILIYAAIAGDKYLSFAELAQFEKQNTDFKIVIEDKLSPTTLLAIHGGKIERGTTELMNAIGGDFNTYSFEGLKEDGNFDLHLTSSKFDEPSALALVKKSKTCLSLHGYIGKGQRSAFCIGGKNKNFAKNISSSLANLGSEIEVIYPCHSYPGEHQDNIVNRCSDYGVQIEMNTALRDLLVDNQNLRNQVGAILKSELKKEENRSQN